MPITTNQHETTEALDTLMEWGQWEIVLEQFYDATEAATEVTTRPIDEVI